MSFSVNLMRRLDVLEPPWKAIWWTILDEIEQHREISVTKTEFNELKGIVKELGQTTKALAQAQYRTEQRLINLVEAQNRTDQRWTEAQARIDQRLASLAQTQEELAQAQKGVMKAIGELTQAQQQTEQEVTKLSRSLGELTQAQQQTKQQVTKLSCSLEDLIQVQKQTEQEIAELSRSAKGTRTQVGGLARSMSYALENEAYRQLPIYLKDHYQIEITEQFIRTVIGGEEINLFAKATCHTEPLLVVGETVLRLDDRAKIGQLGKNVQVVATQFHQPVFPLIVTHFANPAMLEQAREQGVLVVQSFEWK
ncbi:MAG: hypothetical protein HC877_00990 [Thioploca sp.]|nr:hypothetical protein [Thioploca sp.]